MNNYKYKNKEEIQKRIEELLGKVDKLATIRNYFVELEENLSREIKESLEEAKNLNEELKKMNGKI